MIRTDAMRLMTIVAPHAADCLRERRQPAARARSVACTVSLLTPRARRHDAPPDAQLLTDSLVFAVGGICGVILVVWITSG